MKFLRCCRLRFKILLLWLQQQQIPKGYVNLMESCSWMISWFPRAFRRALYVHIWTYFLFHIKFIWQFGFLSNSGIIQGKLCRIALLTVCADLTRGFVNWFLCQFRAFGNRLLFAMTVPMRRRWMDELWPPGRRKLGDRFRTIWALWRIIKQW